MSNDLVRFSVAMPEGLLMEFDQLVARRGLAKNRSEVVRDLVRDALVEEECATPGGLVMGTLTIIYDHHSNDLQEKLHTIQHDYFDTIISTMHVHVDEHMCLEVIVMRGETGLVQSVANLILGTKGVKNGKLVESNAKWSEDDGAFVLKTRTLGNYVFSDVELNVTETVDDTTKNPDTGANDVVGIAAALGAVALVSAAAVSLKK